MTGLVAYVAATLYTVVVTNWDAPIIQPYLLDSVSQHMEQYVPASTRPVVYQNGLIVEHTVDERGRVVGSRNIDIVSRSGKSKSGKIEWTYQYYHVDFEQLDAFLKRNFNRQQRQLTHARDHEKADRR